MDQTPPPTRILAPRRTHERWPVGTTVAKKFGDVIYIASVTRILPPTDNTDEKLWHVVYRDDDEEDMNEREMTEAHKLYLEDGVDCVDGEVDDSNESSDDEYNPLE